MNSLVGYAVTIGLIFGGFILGEVFITKKFPQTQAFIKGIAGYATYIGALVALGGLIGLLYLLFNIGVVFKYVPVFGVVTLIGCALAIVVGFLLLMNFLRSRKNLPQEKMEQINAKLTSFQTPIALVAVVYGVIMVIVDIVM